MNGQQRESPSAVDTSTLLWEACHRNPDPDAVWQALEGGADLGWAAAAAVGHCLVPLLWRTLAGAGARDVLGAERDRLEAAADAFRMEALLLIPSAVALAIRPLTDAGLEPVVLKGPAVASRYPEPGLRPMDDIDLLLPEAEHAHALETLQRVGWQIGRAGTIGFYDTVLAHPDVPSLFLELHFGLEGPTQHVTALDPLSLWKRRQPIDCAGTPAFGLPLTEELVVLAAHAGKPHHRFARLVWIADLAMIVGDAAQRGVTVDWSAVRALAEETRCVTVVGVALAMAGRAGVEVPPGIFSLPTHGRRGATVRPFLSETWPLTDQVVPGYQFHYAHQMTDGRPQRMKMLFLHVVAGHGIRRRVLRVATAPQRAFGRAAKTG